MKRITIQHQDKSSKIMNGIYSFLINRIETAPSGNCPVDLMAAFLRLCVAQSCGKCTPCRIGLEKLLELIQNSLDGKGSAEDIELIEKTAHTIVDTADCAIGHEAAKLVLEGITAFKDDYISHIENSRCTANFDSVPCVTFCPAHVDIPGYIALTKAGRYSDAVRLIRKDNPFVSACALICEHPCESRCRRHIVDDSVNIRGIKRFAVDNAGEVEPPENAPSTGKRIAVIGSGPAGLTAAYFLSLMGHSVTVYEKRKKTGGMLRYGIPRYRLPNEYLDRDIDAILKTGVTIYTETEIGKDITVEELKNSYDCVYIAIGAHADKKLRIEGENSKGVMSAVDLLRSMGDDEQPDFNGKNIVVVGGGNVAMDVTRTAVRLGAKSVKCIYRRRICDMTALPEEIEGAVGEGVDIIPLAAPVRIDSNENGEATAIWVKPQIIGTYDRGRAKPYNSQEAEMKIDCDIIVVAIGQDIESKHFEDNGILTKWNCIVANDDASIANSGNIFAGGDCVTGPATVIKAIESGKVAAANIDGYLKCNTEICVNMDIPLPPTHAKEQCGRINMTERSNDLRKDDFELIENSMTSEEILQECSRCLRCDHYGCGSMKGGRTNKW